MDLQGLQLVEHCVDRNKLGVREQQRLTDLLSTSCLIGPGPVGDGFPSLCGDYASLRIILKYIALVAFLNEYQARYDRTRPPFASAPSSASLHQIPTVRFRRMPAQEGSSFTGRSFKNY